MAAGVLWMAFLFAALLGHGALDGDREGGGLPGGPAGLAGTARRHLPRQAPLEPRLHGVVELLIVPVFIVLLQLQRGGADPAARLASSWEPSGIVTRRHAVRGDGREHARTRGDPAAARDARRRVPIVIAAVKTTEAAFTGVWSASTLAWLLLMVGLRRPVPAGRARDLPVRDGGMRWTAQVETAARRGAEARHETPRTPAAAPAVLGSARPASRCRSWSRWRCSWRPEDADQGPAQRIFYIHVPSAWIGFLAFFVVFVASIAFLATGKRRWDDVASASAAVGVVFTTAVLITGPLWGRPVWGVYWTWDPRLTSFLLLWLIYLSYLVLRGYVPEPERRAQYSAVLGIVGFLDVPIVYLSVRWWRARAPGAARLPARRPADVRCWSSLLVGLAAFTLLYLYLLVRAAPRSTRLEHEREEARPMSGAGLRDRRLHRRRGAVRRLPLWLLRARARPREEDAVADAR